MEIQLSAACACHMGYVRRNNEDNLFFQGNILPKDNDGLHKIAYSVRPLDGMACFGVFDGMGGEAWGEEASWAAAYTMQQALKTAECPAGSVDRFLEQLVCEMNQLICEKSSRHGSGRMGSTAAILCFDQNQVCQCNLGDSRIFRLRGEEFFQMSRDHTDALFLQKNGINRRPRLTQHLGIFPEEMILEPYIVRSEIKPGDSYLLCSDGLTDMLTDAQIRQVLCRPLTPSQQVELLLEGALANGGRDNITIIVISVQNIEADL